MKPRRTNRPRACPFITSLTTCSLTMQSSGLSDNGKFNKFPGAYGDVEPLRTIPNSVVKHICGKDTLGVAPRENSSVPGYQSIPSLTLKVEGGILHDSLSHNENSLLDTITFMMKLVLVIAAV